MLDDCKGERLEEVLAAFSTAVLKKLVKADGARPSVAQQIAMENLSYTGERGVLSALNIAHKTSLQRMLSHKSASKARYADLAQLLSLKEKQVVRRHMQVRSAREEYANAEHISPTESRALEEVVRRNWTGSADWLQALLHGEGDQPNDRVLRNSYDKLWQHVDDGNLEQIEDQQQAGLIEQLERRVKEQKQQLARWQSFEKTFLHESKPPDKSAKVVSRNGIDLGFQSHQSVQILAAAENIGGPESLEAHLKIVESMKNELAEVMSRSTSSLKYCGRRTTGKGSYVNLYTERKGQNDASRTIRHDVSALKGGCAESPLCSTSVTLDTNYNNSAAKDADHQLTEVPYQSSMSAHGLTLADDSMHFEGDSSVSHTQPTSSADSILATVATNFSLSTNVRMRGITAIESVKSAPQGQKHLDEDHDDFSELPKLSTDMNRLAISAQRDTSTRMLKRTARQASLKRESLAPSTLADLPVIEGESELARRTRLSIANVGRQSPVKHTIMEPILPSEMSSPAQESETTRRARLSIMNFDRVTADAQLARQKGLRDMGTKKKETTLPIKKLARMDEESDSHGANGLVSGFAGLNLDEIDCESAFKSRPKVQLSPPSSPVKVWSNDE